MRGVRADAGQPLRCGGFITKSTEKDTGDTTATRGLRASFLPRQWPLPG
jgi:hypothetical protein